MKTYDDYWKEAIDRLQRLFPGLWECLDCREKGMKTATNPAGKTIYFEEDRHRYFAGDVVLTSVTTFIDSFFPEFKTQEMAEKFAEKHNRKVGDVLSEWEAAKEKGIALGNAVHEYAYGEITGDHWQTDEKYEGYYRSVDKALAQIKAKYKILESESIVFCEELGLAGTIDLLVGDSDNLIILDWKTNKQIKQDNVWETALSPISHLDDCELSRYSLQVNTYELILRQGGYCSPGVEIRRGIIHLGEDQVHWYKVGDYQDEVTRMLEWI